MKSAEKKLFTFRNNKLSSWCGMFPGGEKAMGRSIYDTGVCA